MIVRTAIRTAFVALVIVAGTGAAFAKTAWVDDDTKVKEDPKKSSATIAWAKEGQKVNCISFKNGYCYAERKGQDGWIDTDDLVFKKAKKDVDIEFCLGGPYGSFCIEN